MCNKSCRSRLLNIFVIPNAGLYWYGDKFKSSIPTNYKPKCLSVNCLLTVLLNTFFSVPPRLRFNNGQ